MLNHQLHFGVILPQFKISTALTSDYVYAFSYVFGMRQSQEIT
jgi:hypothetical protein